MRKESGFTLIEALVALGIAATALVVLMGRLGASADVQYTLATHALALDVAANELARISLDTAATTDEKSGSIETGGLQMQWRSWTEETMLEGFVRRNVAVKAAGEPEVTLFLYQEVR